MTARPLRISHVGLRGIVGEGLTAAHVFDFSAAYGTFLGPPGSGCAVVVGRDPRASGVMMEEAVVASLVACGHDVIRLGIVSTPVVQHAIRRFGAAGGISIGASHNGVGWNALKFFAAGGTYLTTAQAGELLDIYHLKAFSYATWDALGSEREERGALDAYLDELAEIYDFAALRRHRVIVDCCNGTSGLILGRLNERFGFGFILINARTNGRQFAHEPATNARTVDLQLAPLVEPVNACAGFLFDVDSDRVAMATERGVAVSEELILPILADHLLPKSDARMVITNLSTTALVEEVAARHGGEVVRVPVGRQAAMDALATYPAARIALAGEGTGAVMMSRFRFVYDGIASMLSILEFLDGRGAPMSEIIESYPRYSMLKAEEPLVSNQIPALLRGLQEAYASGRANTSDGLRIDWPDRWFHVRVSQTEPIVRILCEQRGDAPRELMDDLIGRVRGIQ